MSCRCMTRASQQEYRGILEQMGSDSHQVQSAVSLPGVGRSTEEIYQSEKERKK